MRKGVSNAETRGAGESNGGKGTQPKLAKKDSGVDRERANRGMC